MRYRLFFIGALDYPNVPQAGDAVKNRYLLSFFKEKLKTVKCVDTQKWKKNPFVLFKVMGNLLFRRFDNIVISTSNVSAYRLIRLTTGLHLKSRIYYFMIGGYTPVKIKQGIYRTAPFYQLERIIVEADKVSELYHEVGLDNTYRLYNFKPILYSPEITKEKHEGIVRFVFLSRLTRLKGIFHIIDSVRLLDAEGLTDSFEVDFYGRIDEDIKSLFISDVEKLPNVSYKGFLDLNVAEGYRVLSSYDAMLFPTMHVTEGFPGVIADASFSALPVIASNWSYAEEIIGDGECGILFPVGDKNALVDIMRMVINNRNMLQPMRENALKRSVLYDVKKVLNDELIKQLNMDKPI